MIDRNIIAGSGGCFVASTTVLTPTGYVNISDILVGDYVISFDDKGILHNSKVLDTSIHYELDVYEYSLWGGNTLVATPNHWVLTSENFFCELKDINESLSLINTSGLLVPIIDTKYIGKATVYNLIVEGNHTYIANNIRVHNGGGGKGSKTPVNSPDTLRSTSYAHVLDAICEGEIEGFAKDDPDQCIYINNTPLKNSTGTYNFTDYEYTLRTGLPDQDYIPGFDSVEVPGNSTYNGKVQKELPRVISIPVGVIDRVRVTLGIPALSEYKDNGDNIGAEVRYNIAISRNGGVYATEIEKTLSGKCSSRYEFSHIITLNKLLDTDYFDIKVTRITEDSTSLKLQNEIWVDGYTLITDTKLRYPHTAMVGVKIASEQFNTIPVRGYHLKLMKVKLPSNYEAGGVYREVRFIASTDMVEDLGHTFNNGEQVRIVNCGVGEPTLTEGKLYYIVNKLADNYQLSLTSGGAAIAISNSIRGTVATLPRYVGIWDGQLTNYGWTNNPAWCFYDLLTDKRYGLGEYIDETLVDKWALYSIAQYCDVLVPDGSGGQEPRFTLNTYIQTKEDAIKLVMDLASVFRGMVYYSEGGISLSQDSNTDSSAIQFTNSNVVNGSFEYSGASRKVIHTAVLVSWNDPRALYNQKIEYVEDREAIERYGYNPTEIVAFGCTSRGQAHRLGKWLLYTEKVESNIVSFKAGLESGFCRPGQIIKVFDEGMAAVPYSGRVLTRNSNTQVTLDREVTLATTNTYYIRFNIVEEVEGKEVLNTAVYSVTGVVNTPVTIINITGGTLHTNVSSNTIWSISSSILDEDLYRIVSIKESDQVGLYDISALKHKPGKFDYIENDIEFDDSNYSSLTGIPNMIPYADISYSQGTRIDPITGANNPYLTVSFKAPMYATKFNIEIRHGQGNWEMSAFETTNLEHSIYNLITGDYYSLRITPLNSVGKAGPSTTFTDILIYASSLPLPAVAEITYSIEKGYIHFEWVGSNSDPNFDFYEVTLGETYETSLLGYTDIYSPYLDYYTKDLIDDNLDNIYKFWFVAYNKAGIRSIPVHVDIPLDEVNGLISLTTESAKDAILLKWELPEVIDNMVATEIWASETNNRASATLIESIAIPGLTYLHAVTDQLHSKFYYWGRILNNNDLYSAWYPVSPTAGIFGSAMPLVPSIEIGGYTGFSVNAGGSPTPASAILSALVNNVENPTYSWVVDPPGCLLSGSTSQTCTIAPTANINSITVTLTVDGDGTDGQPLAEPLVKSVTMPVVYSGAPGQAGQHGMMSAFPTIYKWTTGTTPPTRPTTQSSYIWATGSYTAPSTWGVEAPTNLTPGSILWRITIPLTTVASTVSSVLDWTNVAYDIVSIAKNGELGPPGPAGPPGTNGNSPVSFILQKTDIYAPTNTEVNIKLGRPPMVGDIATVQISSGEYRIYEYLPSGWIQQILRINGSLIVENTITASRLVSKTITAASGVIDDLAVDSLQIANNAVTVPLFGSNYPYYNITGNSAMQTAVTLYPYFKIAPSAVILLIQAQVEVPGKATNISMEILRDGISIYWTAISTSGGFTNTHVFSVSDVGVLAGSHTYDIRFASTTNMGTRSYTLQYVGVTLLGAMK